MTTTFGTYVRQAREKLQDASDSGEYSLRKVAARVGVGPAYLSQVERDAGSPPTEATVQALAADLKLDMNVLLAMAGKVSSELQAIIMKRPQLFAEMLSACRDLPDHAIVKLVREVRDGDW
jgi:HTH-type transcriptional regulator, competence development regulator